MVDADEGYRRRFARGVIAGGGGQLAARALGLVAVPLSIKLLGAELFGVWSVGSILIGSQGIADFGVAAAAAKYVAEADAVHDRDACVRLVRLVLGWYVAFSAVVCPLLVVLTPAIVDWLHVADAHRGDAEALLTAGALLFGYSNLALALTGVMQGLQRLQSVNVAYVVGQCGYVVVLAAAVKLQAGPLAVAWAMTALVTLQLGGLLAALRGSLPERNDSTKPAPRVAFRGLMGFGVRVQLSTATDFLLQQFPKLAAGALGGASAVTQVDLALRLPQLASGLSGPLLPPLLPAVARLQSRGDQRGVAALFERVTQYVGFTVLTSTALLIILGPNLLVYWIGGFALDSSGAPLRWFTLSAAAMTLSGPITSVAFGVGRPGVVSIYKALALVLTVVLGTGLAALGGVSALAAGCAFGQVGAILWLASELPRIIPTARWRSWLENLGRPLIAASVVATGGLGVLIACGALDASNRATVLSGLAVAASLAAASGHKLDLLPVRAVQRALSRTH